MNYLVKAAAVTCLISLMACTFGNGHICGPQTPQAYCDREAYQRLMHPKGLGEYWEKPGMTVDSWRRDWVSCGGMNDGGYSAGVPPRSSEKILRAAIDTKLNHLWVCMSEKGYHFTDQWSSDW